MEPAAAALVADLDRHDPRVGDVTDLMHEIAVGVQREPAARAGDEAVIPIVPRDRRPFNQRVRSIVRK